VNTEGIVEGLDVIPGLFERRISSFRGRTVQVKGRH
jgi:hypothetical protein